MFRKAVLSIAAGFIMLPMTATEAGYSYDKCPTWAKQIGVRTTTSLEMNLTGCVYSRTYSKWVARSNKCNALARKLASNNSSLVGRWELARQVNRYDSSCETNNNGTYYID